MIKITVSKYMPYRSVLQYLYICAKCGRELIFFKNSPKVCHRCRRDVPELDRLLVDLGHRIECHFE